MSNYVDNYQIKENTLLVPPVVVNTASALQALEHRLVAETTIAVDTESDSLYSFFEKVCLLQISTCETDYVVDPLAFTSARQNVVALAPIFSDAKYEKVFHAAEYDILCLKRDYQFTFANIFDTMVVARILGWKNVGLGNILQERFGVTLNKKMQRADWGKRPLTDEQIAYAREDTHYLLRLRDLQMEELEKVNRLQEAREEFERLTRVEPTPRRFDPDAYWSIAGARDLSPVELGILRELYNFRNQQARREDRPPFKILSDATLVHLATVRPTSTRALTKIGGVSPYVIQRYSTAILNSVARGTQLPQMARPHPRGRGDPILDNAARTRLGKLKEWRKARAQARGVENDVIVSNDVLTAIALKNPRTIETLVAVSGLGPWKANEYGEEMLAVLRGKRR